MTKEFPCTCKSEFQDNRYGHGIRVFNERVAGSKIMDGVVLSVVKK